MATDDRDEDYRWRETYFVFFESANKPELERVVKSLSKLKGRFELSNPLADMEGRFESITLYAPQDFSALEVSFEEGDEVREQAAQIAQEMRNTTLSRDDLSRLSRLPRCSARLDVMHFERVADAGEEGDEMFDPSALLIVLERLAELTQGIAIDPQSGSFM
jgi:hypothetical protein